MTVSEHRIGISLSASSMKRLQSLAAEHKVTQTRLVASLLFIDDAIIADAIKRATEALLEERKEHKRLLQRIRRAGVENVVAALELQEKSKNE